jgi:hypothetical protein
MVEDEVRRALAGLQIPAGLVEREAAHCLTCDGALDGKRRHAKYCSSRCRVRAHRARQRTPHSAVRAA